MNFENGDKKTDVASKINSLITDFLEYINYEFPEEKDWFYEKVNDDILSLINIDKPRVMVYGIYNSGKSTLVNSLCKREVAQMADRPMTDEICEYDKGEYYIVDSPGVDAPIEHELVTEEYLNKCHVILFVISDKGSFEDRSNYVRLSKLIEKNIPFIIVLNDRGVYISNRWPKEKQNKARKEHEDELKSIQHRIIENLIRESGNKNIVDKYEVVVVNAKKALGAIKNNKPELYKKSHVEFLDERIQYLINGNESLRALFEQPISNMKECLKEVERLVTQIISGNQVEDLTSRIYTLGRKKDNILDDLKIICKQTILNNLEDLTNLYTKENTDAFEGMACNIITEINSIYSSKMQEIFNYVNNNFKKLDLKVYNNVYLNTDYINIERSSVTINLSEREYLNKEFDQTEGETSSKIKIFDIFKSNKKREEEKRQKMEEEAIRKNEYEKSKVQEEIRIKQEARQLASNDLNKLNRAILDSITKSIHYEYDALLSQIQQLDYLNKQALEDGNNKMEGLKKLRNNLMEIENEII